MPRTHRLVALLVTSASPSCDEDAEYLLCTPPAVECAGVRGGGGESVSQNSTMHIDAPHAKIAVTRPSHDYHMTYKHLLHVNDYCTSHMTVT